MIIIWTEIINLKLSILNQYLYIFVYVSVCVCVRTYAYFFTSAQYPQNEMEKNKLKHRPLFQKETQSLFAIICECCLLVWGENLKFDFILKLILTTENKNGHLEQ